VEPVPVTRGVRRTVRMAVALVVGQAMLCALIGWLTLGRNRPDPVRPPGSAVVDQLAVPPLGGPEPSLSRSSIAPATQERRAATKRPSQRRSTPAPAAPTTPPTRSPEPILAPPDDPVAVTPAPPSPPATSSTPAPSSPTASPPTLPSASPAFVPDPVEVGDECRPVGAYGRTAEGELVRCVREWRHRARWKIV
jgi:hypothetical protein